jgi:uncharacterized protein YjeT (DUF2065 family)
MGFAAMFARLLKPGERSRASITVEVFGWLIMLEGTLMLFAPAGAASILHLPTLVEQAENYFRLIGLLVGGLGMIYVVSGRLDAEGFVFASMLDRPLVPLVMATLWYLKLIPWQLALAFSIQDFGSFLWTLFTWRKEQRS